MDSSQGLWKTPSCQVYKWIVLVIQRLYFPEHLPSYIKITVDMTSECDKTISSHRNKARMGDSLSYHILACSVAGDRRNPQSLSPGCYNYLRMRHIYVASFVWTSTKSEWNAPNANVVTRVWTFHLSWFDLACFDHLWRETYAKHSVCAWAFRTLIDVTCTP